MSSTITEVIGSLTNVEKMCADKKNNNSYNLLTTC